MHRPFKHARKKDFLYVHFVLGAEATYLIANSNKGVPIIVIPRSIAVAHALRGLVPQQQEIPHKEITLLL
jgi:hypothetical protein